jgi:hypothetical protein
MSEHGDDTSERIGAAIRAAAAQVSAPAELRAQLARDRVRSAPRHGLRLRPRAVIAGGLALATLAAVALLIVLAPGSAGAPSVADAAGVALSAPTQPAPKTNIGDPRFIQASVAGVRFPNYAYEGSWRTVGGRIDTIGRRRSQTVAYARERARVGYTIVEGRPLQAPPGARRADAAGTPVWVVRLDGVLVVSWERDRHTCVLASRTAALPEMLRLVAWHDEA